MFCQCFVEFGSGSCENRLQTTRSVLLYQSTIVFTHLNGQPGLEELFIKSSSLHVLRQHMSCCCLEKVKSLQR